jgi:hypothetical protein
MPRAWLALRFLGYPDAHAGLAKGRLTAAGP